MADKPKKKTISSRTWEALGYPKELPEAEVGPPSPQELDELLDKNRDLLKYAPHLLRNAQPSEQEMPGRFNRAKTTNYSIEQVGPREKLLIGDKEAAERDERYEQETNPNSRSLEQNEEKRRQAFQQARREQILNKLRYNLRDKDWERLAKENTSVEFRSPDDADQGKPEHSYYQFRRFEGKTPMPAKLRMDKDDDELALAHEMGHEWGAGDLYTKGASYAEKRTHRPSLMDNLGFSKKVIQTLRERGLPEKEIKQAVIDELAYPEEHYGVPVQPRLKERGVKDWRSEKKSTRPWAKKANPYKDWDDWDERADEYVERRIPSPIKRKVEE